MVEDAWVSVTAEYLRELYEEIAHLREQLARLRLILDLPIAA